MSVLITRGLVAREEKLIRLDHVCNWLMMISEQGQWREFITPTNGVYMK